MFEYTEDQLRSLADEALRHARSIGATDAVVELAENTGLNVNVRKRRVETIEKTRDKSFGVTVYVGKRRGHASSSDFGLAPLRETIDAAFQIARFPAEDDCAGLPDADLLARRWRAPMPRPMSSCFRVAPIPMVWCCSKPSRAACRSRRSPRRGRAT